MPDIDWQSEVNTAEGEVETQLRRALIMAHRVRRVIVVMEETSDKGDDSTFLSLLSSTMTSNEQMGILYRALAFSEYGNREPEQYHFDPEED